MSNRQENWPLVIRRLAFTACLFALLPCVFLTIYIQIFGAPTSSIAPHFYVVASLLAGLTGVRLGISLLPVAQVVCRIISSAFLVCAGFAAILFYSLVLIGLTQWKRVTTFDMASTYVLQTPDLLRTLGYSPIFAAAFFALIFTGFWYIAYVFLTKADWAFYFNQKISKLASGVISLCLIAIAVIFAIGLSDRDWGGLGEPLSLSLFPAQRQKTMQSHAIDIFRSAQIDREEDAARLAYRPNEKSRHSNVILIVSDALRADHLSLFGYSRKTTPYLDALHQAGRMQLATSVTTVCNESSCGLRALASSRYVDKQAAHPITLHETLKRHGYRVHLVFSGDHTNFDGLSEIYGKVDSYFDGASQKKLYLNDDQLIIDHLNSFERWDGTPTMLQFHLMSSHALGKRFDDTPEFGLGENYTAIRWGSNDARMPQRATNFYDRGVLQADKVISNILKILEERGYLQDALVVITGDHGEALGERGLYSHTHSVWEESLRVPFLLSFYGSEKAGDLRNDAVLSQVDIAPTLLDLLKIPIPSPWDGMSFRDSNRPRVIYFQQAQLIGLVDSRMPGKIYKHWIDARANLQYTFDLISDPHETKNITSQINPSLREEWQQLLKDRSAALAPIVRERLEQASKNGTAH